MGSDPVSSGVVGRRGGTRRADLILVDYLRNNRTNTSIAALSTRARPGAPVSMPLAWPELTAALDPARFTVPDRLARQKTDPWSGYFRSRQRLAKPLIAALQSAAMSQ